MYMTSTSISAAPNRHTGGERAAGQGSPGFCCPLAYDISEVCPPEEMREMAAACEALWKELYG